MWDRDWSRKGTRTLGWLAVLSSLTAVPGMGGESSRTRQPVEFDVPAVVGARPATPSSEHLTAPDWLSVEIVLPVSTIVPDDHALPPYQLWLQLLPIDPIGQIVDFSPRTELGETLAAPLQIDRQQESNTRIGLNLNGAFPVGNGQAVGDVASRDKEVRRISQLPPKLLLVASGTMSRGRGLFYKFKPSSQTTLEGRRDLRFTLDVPPTWRGTVWRLDALARTVDGSDQLLGRSTFFIATYRAGDADAFAAARRYAAAESRFRRAMRIVPARPERAEHPRWLRDVQHLVGWPTRPAARRRVSVEQRLARLLAAREANSSAWSDTAAGRRAARAAEEVVRAYEALVAGSDSIPTTSAASGMNTR